jgi:hypothetical protein
VAAPTIVMTMTITATMPSAQTVILVEGTPAEAAVIKENILNWRMFLTYSVRKATSLFVFPLTFDCCFYKVYVNNLGNII